MQEIVALLLTPETRGAVEERLQAELNRCLLEAETVEIVFVFWMAAQQNYSPPPDFGSNLPRPSLLASMLVTDMGRTLCGNPDPPPEMVPAGFQEPTRFRELQGFDVPRTFLTRLGALQRDTGLPFVAQCAFEWAMTDHTYPKAPIQGDLGYFVRPIGEGMTGAFATRAMLRMLTAFQRTLDVARVYWDMPDEVALHYAVEALPLDPTLAFLRPLRPRWLPQLGKQVAADSESVEAFIRSAVVSLAANQPGTVLLSLVSPVYVDSREIVELSVVRWRRWGAISVDAGSLANRFYERQSQWGYGTCESLDCGITTFLPPAGLDSVLDHDTNAAPMAAVHGFDRIGYLQRDLYPARLYYPIVTGLDHRLVVEPKGGGLQISSEKGPLAEASYWNAGWSPVHPTAISGLCGTALVGATDSLQVQSEPPPDGHFYLWQVNRLRRSNSHEAYVADEPEYGAVSD